MTRFSIRWLTILMILLAVAGCSSGGGSDDPTPDTSTDVTDSGTDTGSNDGDDGSTDSGNDDGGTDDGDDSDDDTPAEVRSSIIDAASFDAFTYFNLETGTVVALDAASAATSTDWHIAFRRYDVILNGGTSGPGNTGGALLVAQDDFYNSDGTPNTSVFLNATPATELEHLTADADTTALSYVEDANVSAISIPETMNGSVLDMGWFYYDTATHAVSVNTDNWWLLRGNGGNTYARFHAQSLSHDSATGLTVSFEFEVQPDGASGFTDTATFNASVAAAGGAVCFDFDTDATVDCAGSDWDLKLDVVGRDWTLWSNGGVSGAGDGAAFGPFTTAQKIAFASGTTTITGDNIASHYKQDFSGGIFATSAWWEYDLDGRHTLWPNYRVYAIDLDVDDEASPVYKLQLTSYYSDAGTSGYPNIRWQLAQ